jgi:hypothetical protein
MLANLFPYWWITSYHYNAYLVVILVFAAVDGAARLDRQLLARQHRAAEREHSPVKEEAAEDAGADDGGADDGGAGGQATRAPASRGLRSVGPRAVAAPWSLALACVAAMCAVAVCLVPHFAFGPALHPSFYQQDAQAKAAAAVDAVIPSGVTVEAVDNLGPQLSARDTVLLWDGDGDTPPLGAPWVVANVREPQFTFTSVREQKQRVALLERSGYQVVFERGGYVVLHRVDSLKGASAFKESAG